MSVLLASCSAGLAGQERAGPVTSGPEAAAPAATQPLPKAKEAATTPDDYFGPEDQIVIFSPDLGEISGKPLMISMGGFIDLPLAGRIKASGKTVQELNSEIISHLHTYVREPSVVITVTAFHSQPVSVVGAVGTPGIHQLEGKKTLVEMLSLAGGVKNDAGDDLTITRSLQWGRLPLPNAKDDPTGQFSVAEVKLGAVTSGKSPEENIQIRPHDVISVPRAHLVYVIGEVPKAGGFVLEERESMSVLQALSLAGGLGPEASPQKAKILREQAGATKREEIPVDLKKILAGTQEDFAMKSEDILFVPSSLPKKAGIRAAQAVLETTTGVIIWRGGHL